MRLGKYVGLRGPGLVMVTPFLGQMTGNFGVEVTSVEIRDVTIHPGLQDAISWQAEAERERRSRVILAEADHQAAGKMP